MEQPLDRICDYVAVIVIVDHSGDAADDDENDDIDNRD
jgi:hypothetical protein